MEHWENKGSNFFLHENFKPGWLNSDELYMNVASMEVEEIGHSSFFSAPDTLWQRSQ